MEIFESIVYSQAVGCGLDSALKLSRGSNSRSSLSRSSMSPLSGRGLIMSRTESSHSLLAERERERERESSFIVSPTGSSNCQARSCSLSLSLAQENAHAACPGRELNCLDRALTVSPWQRAHLSAGETHSVLTEDSLCLPDGELMLTVRQRSFPVCETEECSVLWRAHLKFRWLWSPPKINRRGTVRSHWFRPRVDLADVNKATLCVGIRFNQKKELMKVMETTEWTTTEVSHNWFDSQCRLQQVCQVH